jgi:long-chain fatty acid transport protein
MKAFLKLMPMAVTAALATFPGAVQASGFALIEQNASGLGNAFAGQGASAQDASTIYFNPAGMTRLPGKNLVLVGHLIDPSAKFNNTGTTPAVSTIAGTGPFALNGNGGDAGDLALVPNGYLSWQINPQWYVGVGLSAPFGLKTEYDANWMGRFHALKSELTTINVNPSVAFKLSDAVSLGFGINWQRAEAELTKAVNYSFVASAGGIPGVPPGTEGSNKIEGDDEAWGWNAGAMFNMGDSTRIGITYRSAISYTLSGSALFFGRPAAATAVLGGVAGAAAAALAAAQIGDSPITADLKVPASASWSIFHQLNPQWDLLGDITWTQWSSLEALNIVRNTGFVLESTPFKWRDTWRIGVGANYRPNQTWTVRFGVAYDETPTSDLYRTPRIPDQNRTWLAVGGQYKISNASAIDFGYAHLFVSDPTVSLTGPPALTTAQAAGRGSLIGNYDSKVDILSVQFRYSF